MKKALALGPAAYAAPMILGSSSPAYAQVSGVCSPQTCGNFTGGCLNQSNCFCWTGLQGQGICGHDFSCAGLTTCSQQSPCPTGFFCAVNTCCGPGVCSPNSTLCVAGQPQSGGVQRGPGTAAGPG